MKKVRYNYFTIPANNSKTRSSFILKGCRHCGVCSIKYPTRISVDSKCNVLLQLVQMQRGHLNNDTKTEEEETLMSVEDNNYVGVSFDCFIASFLRLLKEKVLDLFDDSRVSYLLNCSTV